MEGISQILESLPNRVQATAVKNTLVANERHSEGMDNVQEEVKPFLSRENELKHQYMEWGLVILLGLLVLMILASK